MQQLNPSQTQENSFSLSPLTTTLLVVCLLFVVYFVEVYKPMPSSSNDVFTTSPALSASQVDAILKAYNSPAQGLGTDIYNLSVQTGVNDSFTMGVFLQESTMGRYGVATVSHNVGNIRCTEGYTCYEGYRSYASWVDGFKDLDNLLVNLYKVQFKATTVQDIITRYAPASDNNDTQKYIQHVQESMQQWSAGKVVVNFN